MFNSLSVCSLYLWLHLRVCEYLHVPASVRLNRGHSNTKWKKNGSLARATATIMTTYNITIMGE